MATIEQFQSGLQRRAKRNFIEQEIGRTLMQRIESAGGRLEYNGKNFFEFVDVSPELRPELDKKLPYVREKLLKW